MPAICHNSVCEICEYNMCNIICETACIMQFCLKCLNFWQSGQTVSQERVNHSKHWRSKQICYISHILANVVGHWGIACRFLHIMHIMYAIYCRNTKINILVYNAQCIKPPQMCMLVFNIHNIATNKLTYCSIKEKKTV